MRLINESDLSYPIILRSNRRVMDAMDRVVKIFLQGNDVIKAVQFSKDPEPDYANCRTTDLPY